MKSATNQGVVLFQSISKEGKQKQEWLLFNSLQPTLFLKRNRPSHWTIDKLITANEAKPFACYQFEMITGHPFKQGAERTPWYGIRNSNPKY